MKELCCTTEHALTTKYSQQHFLSCLVHGTPTQLMVPYLCHTKHVMLTELKYESYAHAY